MAASSFREISQERWAVASRRAAALDRVLASTKPRSEAVAIAATELRLSERQILRLLKRYEGSRRVSDLFGRYGHRSSRLHPRVEAIITEELDAWSRDKEEPALTETVGTIGDRCEEEGFARPSYATVQSRCRKLPIEAVLRRQPSAEAAHRLRPRPGYIKRPNAPLDHVQIDSTRIDLVIVDRHYKVLGRPWLVLAVDVYSGAPVGFLVTLEPPSAITTALCLTHAVQPKEAWLKARGLDLYWPMKGLMGKLSMDGGSEFDNEAVNRACGEYRIKIPPRRAYNKQDRSIIERLIGTMMGFVRSIPGKTGRNVVDRGDYPSEDRACLQLHELEKVLAYAIAGVYLHEPNSKTHKVPLIEWEEAAARIEKRPFDPDRFYLDFLPREKRKLDSFGFSLYGLDYFDDQIRDLIADRDRVGKIEIAVDPRDVSHVYVLHPKTGKYVQVGRRDKQTDLISLAEVRAEHKALKERGKASHRKTFGPRRHAKAIVANAKEGKAAARRQARNEAAEAERPHKRPEKQVVELPKDDPTGTPQRFDVDLAWKV